MLAKIGTLINAGIMDVDSGLRENGHSMCQFSEGLCERSQMTTKSTPKVSTTRSSHIKPLHKTCGLISRSGICTCDGIKLLDLI